MASILLALRLRLIRDTAAPSAWFKASEGICKEQKHHSLVQVIITIKSKLYYITHQYYKYYIKSLKLDVFESKEHGVISISVGEKNSYFDEFVRIQADLLKFIMLNEMDGFRMQSKYMEL